MRKPDVGAIRNRITEVKPVLASELAPHPGNWRDHPDNQAMAMAGVMREVGDVGVLLAWHSERNGGKLTLIDGHLRRDLAPDHQYMVAVTDLTDAEADYVLATHDPLTAMARADAGALDALLSSVQSGEAAVQQMLAELAKDSGLYPAREDDAEPQIDKAEELRVKWGVELGQLWRLGEHRLICGDCTDKAVVERVMGGERARLVFTSPPYADQREYEIGKFDWLALANGMFDALPMGAPFDVVINLGLSYKDGKVNQYWQPWLEHCEANGLPLYGWYVWDKGSGVPGDWGGRLATSHEFLFHFGGGKGQINQWIPKAESTFQRNLYSTNGKQRGADGKIQPVSSPRAQWNECKVPDSVIAIRRDSEGHAGHPAVFPVELPTFIAQTWSGVGDFVYDPFLGSGTTLIACENLGRKCRAVEISPGYVAVALQRWADATGKTPELMP